MSTASTQTGKGLIRLDDAVMPSGVEHTANAATACEQRSHDDAVMPSGVEHKMDEGRAGPAPTLDDALMPSGVEHTR